ncbi:Putative glycosyltransferase [gamma proteobacterium HdN1]|nr:Putative glycosyltransferase [gamma proteobacterium HdN1]
MKILQVLPALNSGGVERGTVDFARELVKRGHESVVVSSGGRMVKGLEAEGSRHIEMAVHRKSLRSFAVVRPMRRLLAELQPDIVHVRSRIPAWIVWLAWRKMPIKQRPRLVSTFHGLYSVSPYSAIMAKSEHMIAISHVVYDYIVENYHVPNEKITLIHRGVDDSIFTQGAPDANWLAELYGQYPKLAGKTIILMPGRLTRWKGQEAFLEMMVKVVSQRSNCHGVVVGGADPEKAHYVEELKQKAAALGLENDVTFVGHRSDIAQFYRLADIVCHMSNKPEPFGRTLTEALACGAKVVAFDRGGATESLGVCFPQGLVPPDNIERFAEKVLALSGQHLAITVQPEFLLGHQVAANLEVYQKLLNSPRA